MKKFIVLLTVTILLSISSNWDAHAGWCEFLNCTDSECATKLEQAEKDKQWLWDQLVQCRKNQIQKPFPQPTEFIELPGATITSIVDNYIIRGIYIADESYKCISTSDFESWLRYNTVSELRYQYDGFDCDDFAMQTVAAARLWFPNLAIGEVWAYEKDGPGHHAIIVIVDIKKNVIFYEPQTDGRWNKIDNWTAYLGKFTIQLGGEENVSEKP